jgi:hypothetical protein
VSSLFRATGIYPGAALLFEAGRFQPDDPIEGFIPQLANRRVLRSSATSLDEIAYSMAL